MSSEWIQIATLLLGGSGVLGFLGVWIKSRYSRADKRDDIHDAFVDRIQESNTRLTDDLEECTAKRIKLQRDLGLAEVDLASATAQIVVLETQISDLQKGQLDAIEQAEQVALENSQRLKRVEDMLSNKNRS